MPNESEFRDAAALIRGTFADVDAASRHIAAAHGSHSVSGGSVADLAATAAQTGVDDVATIRARLEWLSQQCERRAVVCSEHEASLRRWRASHDEWRVSIDRYWATRADPSRRRSWPGPEPVRPSAPFDWVEPR